MSSEAFRIETDHAVVQRIDQYPDHVRPRLLYLRDLVRSCAAEIEDLGLLTETLKWKEPSFVTKKGSTIRMDWKEKTPEQYAIYFSCGSKLVSTFRAVYGDDLSYEGNRAIVLDMNENPPEPKLRACVHAALRYHSIKHLVHLGMKK